jgi:hypothetical protein
MANQTIISSDRIRLRHTLCSVGGITVTPGLAVERDRLRNYTPASPGHCLHLSTGFVLSFQPLWSLRWAEIKS